MATKREPGGPTSIAYPWALVRRMGDQEGKRPSTRMAYLVGTIVGDDGKAVALRGFIGRNDMTGWTKSLRRVEWGEIVRDWRTQPTPDRIAAIKRRMPRVPVSAA
jgi:hypothetical protein